MDHRTSSKFEGVEWRLCSAHNKGEQFFEEKFFYMQLKCWNSLDWLSAQAGGMKVLEKKKKNGYLHPI